MYYENLPRKIRLIADDERFVEVARIGKQIVGDSQYYVSNYGRLYSDKHKKILTPSIRKDGYVEHLLTIERKPRHALTHRLVAMAFLNNPDPENLIYVRHLDRNPKNNHVSNLQWCDASTNIISRNRGKRISRPQDEENEPQKVVAQYGLDKFWLATYSSPAEASRQTGIENWRIRQDYKEGSCKTGFYWKYARMTKGVVVG